MAEKVIRHYDIERDEEGKPTAMYWTGDTVIKPKAVICHLCNNTGRYRGITGQSIICGCPIGDDVARAESKV